MGSQPDKSEYRQLRDTVYTFFYYSNKPVSANEVALQFKNCKKNNLQKVLDDLVAKDKIFFRTIGKSKIYCLFQDMQYQVDESVYTDHIDQAFLKEKTENDKNPELLDDKTLRYLRWCYENTLQKLNLLKEKSKSLDQSLVAFENQLSVEELKRAIKDMKEIIKEDSEEAKGEVISYELFNKKKKQHASVKKEATKRSKIFKEIVEMVCDGCGIKKKDLLNAAGVED